MQDLCPTSLPQETIPQATALTATATNNSLNLLLFIFVFAKLANFNENIPACGEIFSQAGGILSSVWFPGNQSSEKAARRGATWSSFSQVKSSTSRVKGWPEESRKVLVTVRGVRPTWP